MSITNASPVAASPSGLYWYAAAAPVPRSVPPLTVTEPLLAYTAVGPVTSPPSMTSVPAPGKKMAAPLVALTTAPSRIVMSTAESPPFPLPLIAASAPPPEVTATVPYTSSAIPPEFFPNVVMP